MNVISKLRDQALNVGRPTADTSSSEPCTIGVGIGGRGGGAGGQSAPPPEIKGIAPLPWPLDDHVQAICWPSV